MRMILVLMAATALSACGGGEPSTLSGTAPGGGSGGTSSTTTYDEFKAPTVPHTYTGVGGSQGYEYVTDDRFCCGQQAQTFGSNTSTVRNSGASIAYDPSNAVFTLTVSDPNSGAATATRFQDPASRTNFGGSVEPQWGVSKLTNPNYRYLQAGDGDPLSPYSSSGTGAIYPGTNTFPTYGTAGSTYQSTDFFYEVPGTTTNYVTIAGYVRNDLGWNRITQGTTSYLQTKWHLERGAFAYGVTTDNAAVPTTGTGTYTGNMLATMVFNPTIDGTYGAELPTFYQWIEGTATTQVNFATNGVTLGLTGTVSAPQVDYALTFDSTGNPVYVPAAGSTASTVAAGTSFTATGTATVNLVTTGGFTGQFQSASVGATTNGAPTAISIIGSGIAGAFYGPKAEEVGGGFHIVGGVPDQRVDIVGAFTGKKP